MRRWGNALEGDVISATAGHQGPSHSGRISVVPSTACPAGAFSCTSSINFCRDHFVHFLRLALMRPQRHRSGSSSLT
jgi:hypothetical protein